MRLEREHQRILEIARRNIVYEKRSIENRVAEVNQRENLSKLELAKSKQSFKAFSGELKKLKFEQNPVIAQKKSSALDQRLEIQKTNIQACNQELSKIKLQKHELLGKLALGELKERKLSSELKLIRLRSEKLAENNLFEELASLNCRAAKPNDCISANMIENNFEAEKVKVVPIQDLETQDLISNSQIVANVPYINSSQNEPLINQVQELARNFAQNNSITVHQQWKTADAAGIEFTYKSTQGNEIKIKIEATVGRELSLQLDKPLSKMEFQNLKNAYVQAGFKIKSLNFISKDQ